MEQRFTTLDRVAACLIEHEGQWLHSSFIRAFVSRQRLGERRSLSAIRKALATLRRAGFVRYYALSGWKWGGLKKVIDQHGLDRRGA